MAQLHQINVTKDRRQRDSAASKKSDIKNYSEWNSVMGMRHGNHIPFIADWQMSDNKEEMEPKKNDPIYFSF